MLHILLFNTFENTEIELYTLFSKFSIHNFTYFYQKNGVWAGKSQAKFSLERGVGSHSVEFVGA